MVILLKLNSLVKKDKSVCNYYEERLEKLNNLIPDIKDYINEYEMEFGKP